MESLSEHEYGFSTVEYLTAVDILKNIDPYNFKEGDFFSASVEDQEFDDRFPGKNVRNPQFFHCTFRGTKFDGIDGRDSSIVGCTFYASRFQDAGMDFSNFTNTHFLDQTVLDNCGCNECNFSSSEFRDIKMEGSNFERSFFIGATIENVSCIHCCFEESVFNNSHIINSDLTQTCLEFSSFENVIFKNAVMPFWGILKSFGGLKSIQEQSGQVKIRYSVGSEPLAANTFLGMLETLQPFFYKKNQYFVLANINIFLGNQQAALQYALIGLRYCLEKRNFRMIRYLCKLASNNHFFTKTQLHQLYDLLLTSSLVEGMNDHEYQIYQSEMDGIKRLLLDNPFGMPQMVITIHTSFMYREQDELAKLLEFMDASVRTYLPQSYCYVTIRRNSPPILEYLISDVLPNLYSFYFILVSIVFVGNKGVELFQKTMESRGVCLDNRIKEETILQQSLQTERMKLENESLREDIRKKRLENGRALESSRPQSKITVNSVAPGTLPEQTREQIESIGFVVRNAQSESNCVREAMIHADKK